MQCCLTLVFAVWLCFTSAWEDESALVQRMMTVANESADASAREEHQMFRMGEGAILQDHSPSEVITISGNGANPDRYHLQVEDALPAAAWPFPPAAAWPFPLGVAKPSTGALTPDASNVNSHSAAQNQRKVPSNQQVEGRYPSWREQAWAEEKQVVRQALDNDIDETQNRLESQIRARNMVEKEVDARHKQITKRDELLAALKEQVRQEQLEKQQAEKRAQMEMDKKVMVAMLRQEEDWRAKQAEEKRMMAAMRKQEEERLAEEVKQQLAAKEATSRNTQSKQSSFHNWLSPWTKKDPQPKETPTWTKKAPQPKETPTLKREAKGTSSQPQDLAANFTHLLDTLKGLGQEINNRLHPQTLPETMAAPLPQDTLTLKKQATEEVASMPTVDVGHKQITKRDELLGALKEEARQELLDKQRAEERMKALKKRTPAWYASEYFKRLGRVLKDFPGKPGELLDTWEAFEPLETLTPKKREAFTPLNTPTLKKQATKKVAPMPTEYAEAVPKEIAEPTSVIKAEAEVQVPKKSTPAGYGPEYYNRLARVWKDFPGKANAEAQEFWQAFTPRNTPTLKKQATEKSEYFKRLARVWKEHPGMAVARDIWQDFVPPGTEHVEAVPKEIAEPKSVIKAEQVPKKRTPAQERYDYFKRLAIVSTDFPWEGEEQDSWQASVPAKPKRHAPASKK